MRGRKRQRKKDIRIAPVKWNKRRADPVGDLMRWDIIIRSENYHDKGFDINIEALEYLEALGGE